jgi:organic anion transporter 5A
MDGWLSGCLFGWLGVWLDGLIDGWIDGWLVGWLESWEVSFWLVDWFGWMISCPVACLIGKQQYKNFQRFNFSPKTKGKVVSVLN